MITGFNHNIKYKDCIYHVQTEDSGLRNPHVITHLFVGGNIIATKKADYAHLLNEPPDKQPEKIRKLMEEQHKAMLRSLINGKFDNALNTEGAHHLEGPAPLNVSAEVLARTGGSGNKARAEAPRPPAPAPTPARAAPPPPAAAA
ncbi:MAG: hypothetical protein HY904_18720, partial [Deltaproteobacteria bacterium]|nr:hypothetical protein [Deltaproteobacteria bacterium]